MARRTRSERPLTPGLFDRQEGPRRFTVAELTGEIRDRIDGIGRVAVEGELSSLKRHTSGHVYFDLKEEGARLSCVIWRSRVERALSLEPEEGARVVAHGKLDVYAPRGSYSLIVDRLEPLGLGALLQELERLKAELRALGWFDRRRALPAMPRLVGVVTSRDGAALRDFLRTRSLRWPAYPLRFCHAPVQGPGAAEAIARAIQRLDSSGVDVIVVCRGGGSLEDLWAFNERPVAEAVWRASVPVVSAIGHESDTTLIDFVADLRAHTPTDAAQTVFPERRALEAELARWGNFLIEAATAAYANRAERLARVARRPVLRRGDWILGERRESLRNHAARLGHAIRAGLAERRERLRVVELGLERQAPRQRLARLDARLRSAGSRLGSTIGRSLERARGRVEVLARTLEGVSPLKVLARGYSLTRRPGESAPVTDAASVAVGDELETRLHRGAFRARVLDVRETPGA